MRVKQLILVSIGIFSAYLSSAQLKGEYIQPRILILLDGSSSMVQPWSGGKDKFKAAQDLITKLIDSVYAVNNKVQFGLRVFGHQSTVPEHNCYDSKNEVAFSTDNRSQMILRLLDIHPQGITPIAYSLQEAAEKDIINETQNAYSLILITDGGESCNGDICAVMKSFFKNKVYFKPYIISLENDPGLKATYNCMGDFLQVTNDQEVPKAVSTIVEAFRPAFQMSKAEYADLAAKAPSVLKVTIPVKKRSVSESDNISPLSGTALRLINIPTPPMGRMVAIVQEGTMPAVKADVPLPKVNKVAGINPAGLRSFKTGTPTVFRPVITWGDPKLPPVVVEAPPVPREEKIAKLKPAPVTRLYWAMVMEAHALSPRPLPALPPVKVEAPFIKNPTPAETTSKHEIKTEVEDDKETTVQVYFTNGAGKFYTTTPQIILSDPKTKAVVKKFFRTVDPDGNPDPQPNIPPGIYDLTFAGKTNFVEKGIKIEQNKKNKFTVTINSVTLSFAYSNAPNRPMSEFTATVTERNKARGRVQNQPCNEQMKYEPGNYHIEINTFPLEIRNIDLDIDGEWSITIPQPGFAKFSPDNQARNVRLFQHLGDRFVPFYNVNMNDPRNQHLQIQPGEYQVHYQKGPGQSGAAEKVQVFYIRAAEETVIDLK